MSLVPKIDEVRVVANSVNPDFISVKETCMEQTRGHTWSHLLVYRDNIQFSVLGTLSNSLFEVL
jgi:hypothetical protein